MNSHIPKIVISCCILSVLLGIWGCSNEYERTDPINPLFRDIVVSADSVEVFLLADTMACNYRSGRRELPVGGHVELLGDSFGGYYSIERLGVLNDQLRENVETLLFDLDNYSTAKTMCIFSPHYGFRYLSSAGVAVLFLEEDCAAFRAKDVSGTYLEEGNIMPSASKWKRVVEKL